MNVSTSSASSTASQASASRGTAASNSTSDSLNDVRNDARSDAFERALREKAARFEESEDGSAGEDSDDGDQEPAGAGQPAPRMEPLRASPNAPVSAAGAVELAPTGTRAALEAALNSSAPAHVLHGAGEAAQSWQVSLNEPGGAVEVLATRLDRGGLEARPAWSLTIASPALSSEALARHVPQLADRLRVRGVDTAHVRIEGRDPQQERGGRQGGNGRDGERR